MTRLISGLAMAVVAIAAILFLPILPLRVLVCLVAALCADEYLRIVGQRGKAGHVVAIALVIWTCWWVPAIAPLSPALVAIVGVGWLAVETMYGERRIGDVAADLMAVAYIGLPLGMLMAVQTLAGWQATLLLIGTVVVSDSAQYYSGRAFGRRPLAPTISPKKTIEGAIGGVVFGIIFMIVAGGFAVPAMPLPARAGVGAAVVILGIIGDLFESKLKRVAGVKDSSSLIPGHGGVLDRLDALLFATPAFYLAILRTVA